MQLKMGAHASGVWFTASRHKHRHTNLFHRTVQFNDANVATPLAARETRARPDSDSDCIVPAEMASLLLSHVRAVAAGNQWTPTAIV